MTFSDKTIYLTLDTLSGEKRSSSSKTDIVYFRDLNNFKTFSVMQIFTQVCGFIF